MWSVGEGLLGLDGVQGKKHEFRDCLADTCHGFLSQKLQKHQQLLLLPLPPQKRQNKQLPLPHPRLRSLKPPHLWRHPRPLQRLPNNHRQHLVRQVAHNSVSGSDIHSLPTDRFAIVTGSALEDAVNNIVEMGFEKSEVQRAMRASFNNPERAVEYLMTGIPEHLNQPAPSAQPAAGGQATATPAPATTGSQGESQPSTQAPSNTRSGNLFEAAAAQAQGGDAGGRPRGGGGDGMDALRDLGEDDGNGNTALDLGNPAMLAQLRQLVQQNPAALAPLVQALAQSNPQLANAMTEDPEGVLNLLASGAAGGLGGEGEEDVALPSLSELNPEDRTAVEQIVAMGIEENRAIEVYLMCGRNVEMAVQYYFENPQDFED